MSICSKRQVLERVRSASPDRQIAVFETSDPDSWDVYFANLAPVNKKPMGVWSVEDVLEARVMLGL